MAYCLDYFNNSLDNFKNERREQMKLTKAGEAARKLIIEGMRSSQKHTESYIEKYMSDTDPYVIEHLNHISKGVINL